MTLTSKQALIANQIQRECLLEAGDDVESGLIAADFILSSVEFPDETEIDTPGDEPEEDWREEAEPIGTNDGKPVDLGKFFAYDIYNPKAQGILNRSLEAAKGISRAAKKDLAAALKRRDSGEAILTFIEKYRLQLAKLLNATQLASLLEGAREVAQKIPTLPIFPGAVPPPPTLEPEEAKDLVDRLMKLKVEERARALYNLPPDQQVYAQQAITSREAQGPGLPPPITPPKPPAGSPEEIHFPIIDEAVKLMSEKNVMTKEKFDILSDQIKAKSFTVANVQAEETLTKIRDSLAENVKEGVDYETWRNKVMEDVDEGTFMSDAHQEVVYRTNIQSVLSDGKQAVLEHPLVRSGFPYVAQDAIHDDRVEDTHLEVEKIGIQGTNIFRINDPVFQTFRAPWRWNCRCGWNPMTVRHAAEMGIKEAQEWLDTGVEPSPPAFVAMPDFRPPPGFRRSLTSSPLSIQLSMQSLSVFSIEKKPEEEIDESLLMAGGESGVGATGMLDSGSEKPGKKITKIERRKSNLKKASKPKRSLFKNLRVKKKWKPAKSVTLAVDRMGDHHRGRGTPIGGQFTTPGEGEGDVGTGSRERAGLQQSDAASGGVEKQTPTTSDAGTGQGGKTQNQPIDPGTARGVRAAPASQQVVVQRLGKLNEWAQRTGKSYISNWLGDLSKHIETFGAEAALEQLGGPEEQVERPGVAYDPGTEYHKDWNKWTRDYLNHYGIQSFYETTGLPVVSSITPEARGEQYPEGTQVQFRPAESGLTDKLTEAKMIPGLESSEDLSVITGQPVTHITDEVVQALDQRYGQDGWIIKPYTEDAFAGHGIYFPERIRNIQKDAKQAIYSAEQQLSKVGYSLIRNQESGKIAGLQGPYGDSYELGTPEYDFLVKRASKTSSLIGKMITELPEHIANENGVALRNREGQVTDKGYMAQPAFSALQEDMKNRAAGMPYANVEARAHVITQNGQARLVPYGTFYKKRPFPIVFQDEDSKAIEKAALEAVSNVHESERQDHVYAPDIIKTAEGYKVVELNPSNEVGSSGHLGSNPLIIDAYVSALNNRDPGFVQFIKRILTKKQGRAMATELGRFFSIDQSGHRHKGKGHQGGGQFTSQGLEEGDVNAPTKREQRPAADNSSGRGGRSTGRGEGNAGVDTGTAQAAGSPKRGDAQKHGNTSSFTQALSAFGGVQPMPEQGTPELWQQHSAQVIEAAKSAGLFIDKTTDPDLLFVTSSLEEVGGQEHEVYLDGETNTAYKLTSPERFGLNKDVHEYLKRLETAEQLWPSLGYQFRGITQDPETGSAQIVTTMNLVKGVPPQQKEIESWLTKQGWQPYGPSYKNKGEMIQLQWRDPKSETVITDTHPGNFIKTSAGLVPIDVNILPGYSEGDEEPTNIQASITLDLVQSGVPKKASVHRDWGKLRAIVVGTIENNVFAPDPWQPTIKGLPKEGGISYRDFAPEKWARAAYQLNALAELLKSEGVDVYRPPVLSLREAKDLPIGLTQVYVREAFSVIGDTVIMNQTRSPYRRKEAKAMEDFFSRMNIVPLKLLPAPNDTTDSLPDDPLPYFEGGDLYRVGKDVLITMSGLATSPTGFRFIADAMAERGIEVWPAYIDEKYEHGDYILSLIREGLCIAYRKGFIDGLLPCPIMDWDCIDITAEEADPKMGANGIVLGENKIILPKGLPRLVHALEKKGVEVIEIDFDGVHFFQGGIDCSTNEIWRE